MRKVLFVCLGNICRSPAAEAILKHWIHREGREKEFQVDSAGLYGGHSGALPDERMRRHAGKRGYILDSRARQFYATADFTEFDLIIGMDDQNLHQLCQLAMNDEEKRKIYKMTDFCRFHTDYTTIPDPYYQGEEGFETVLDLLEDAVQGLWKKIK